MINAYITYTYCSLTSRDRVSGNEYMSAYGRGDLCTVLFDTVVLYCSSIVQRDTVVQPNKIYHCENIRQ